MPVVVLYFIVFGTPFYFTVHVKLNSNEILKKTVKAVCEQNEVQENLIKKADLDYLSTEELRHLFYEFITKSSEGLCPNWVRLGGEGAELEGLLEWQNSGALTHVQQIGIEYHMEAEWMSQSKHDQYKTILKALQKLYVETNFRLVHYDFNLCWARHVDWVTKANGYPAFSEIVLMRTNKNGLCA